MDRIRSIVKKCLHPFFIICMILIILAGAAIIYRSRQGSVSEVWVRECLQAYGGGLTELDIQVLSKNLSAEIDEKLGEIDFDSELSQEQLMSLMAMVNEGLQYAEYQVSQEEIARLSAEIIKKILAERDRGGDTPQMAERAREGDMPLQKNDAPTYEADERIAVLEEQILKLRKALEESDSQSQPDKIAEETGIDKETVIRWFKELEINLDSTSDSHDAAIKELAELLDVDAKTLQELLEQANAADEGIAYLIKRLGITEEKLNDALKKLAPSNDQELAELIARLSSTEANLQKQIDGNMSLTTNSITSAQQQIVNNKNAADTAIETNRLETDKQIRENKEQTDAAILETDKQIRENKEQTDAAILETDKQIRENKEHTDAAIEELQDNVLFYEYDSSTNTLRMFRNPEGGREE